MRGRGVCYDLVLILSITYSLVRANRSVVVHYSHLLCYFVLSSQYASPYELLRRYDEWKKKE